MSNKKQIWFLVYSVTYNSFYISKEYIHKTSWLGSDWCKTFNEKIAYKGSFKNCMKLKRKLKSSFGELNKRLKIWE